MMARAAKAAGVHVIFATAEQLRHERQIDFMVIDELTPIAPSKSSPKRQALLSQLERAKVRRDKNQIRDLTRQLERTE